MHGTSDLLCVFIFRREIAGRSITSVTARGSPVSDRGYKTSGYSVYIESRGAGLFGFSLGKSGRVGIFAHGLDERSNSKPNLFYGRLPRDTGGCFGLLLFVHARNDSASALPAPHDILFVW